MCFQITMLIFKAMFTIMTRQNKKKLNILKRTAIIGKELTWAAKYESCITFCNGKPLNSNPGYEAIFKPKILYSKYININIFSGGMGGRVFIVPLSLPYGRFKIFLNLQLILTKPVKMSWKHIIRYFILEITANILNHVSKPQ